MCQLTFINLKNKKYNMLFLWNQLFINASAGHPDGHGFYLRKKGIVKSKLNAAIINNYDEYFTLNFKEYGNAPILAHVRLASLVEGYKLKVEDEFAHPFETENFVLAHNGVLVAKNKTTKFESDSEFFLKELDKEYLNLNKNFIEAFQKTIDKFYGKFAFLIYDKNFDKYYCMRNTKATLYLLNIHIKNNTGYVINTEKLTLDRGMNRFKDMIFFMDGSKLKYGEPFPIESNKIFELNSSGLSFIYDFTHEEEPEEQKKFPSAEYLRRYSYYYDK